MFRVSFFVDDRHLAAVLHAVTGRVLELKTEPVANAVGTGKGGVRALTNGAVTPAFREWAKRKKQTSFRPADIREFCREHGKSERSYSHVLGRIQADGALKRGSGKGNRTTYDLTGAR